MCFRAAGSGTSARPGTAQYGVLRSGRCRAGPSSAVLIAWRSRCLWRLQRTVAIRLGSVPRRWRRGDPGHWNLRAADSAIPQQGASVDLLATQRAGSVHVLKRPRRGGQSPIRNPHGCVCPERSKEENRPQMPDQRHSSILRNVVRNTSKKGPVARGFWTRVKPAAAFKIFSQG